VYDFKYTSKKQLLDFLKEKDFNLSSRTLERDIERIRADFGLEIVYAKKRNGYYIDEERSVRVDSFFKFLEIVSLADILSQSLTDSNKILDFISFDDSKYFKGIENLKEVLIAISQNRTIQFIHENFGLETFKEYEITPLLLKEYENRWYVIGVPNGRDEIRTFGIDRISGLVLGELSKIKKRNFRNQLAAFNSIVGLNYNTSETVKVRLLVNQIHVNYMKSLPIHHSQRIHSKNSNGQYYVDFFLAPNYEFKTQILKMGDYVEVIAPQHLREEIKTMLIKTLKQYN